MVNANLFPGILVKYHRWPAVSCRLESINQAAVAWVDLRQTIHNGCVN